MPSKLLKQYIEQEKKEKEGKEGKALVRKRVEKLLRRCQRKGIIIPNVSYREGSTEKLKEDEVYQHVRDMCKDPETKVVDEELFSCFCKQVVDLEKLEVMASALEMEGIVPLPDKCYSSTPTVTITINHKKLNKES